MPLGEACPTNGSCFTTFSSLSRTWWNISRFWEALHLLGALFWEMLFQLLGEVCTTPCRNLSAFSEKIFQHLSEDFSTFRRSFASYWMKLIQLLADALFQLLHMRFQLLQLQKEALSGIWKKKLHSKLLRKAFSNIQETFFHTPKRSFFKRLVKKNPRI